MGIRLTAPIHSLRREAELGIRYVGFNQNLIDGLGNGVMLRDWAHVIAIETEASQVFCHIAIFCWPDFDSVRVGCSIGSSPARFGDIHVAYLAQGISTNPPPTA